MSLKICKNVVTTTQNIIKIMFKIYFSFLLIIFINDIKKSVYFASTDDDETITRCEIIKIIYKSIQIKYRKLMKSLIKRCNSLRE